MEITEVANKLVDYCKIGNWEDAMKELYHEDCESIEPMGSFLPQHVKGMEAMKAKGEQWNGMVEEIHGIEIDGPIVADNFFSCTMKMDITMKGMPRMKSEEICVYKVNDGKVVSEQFFYEVNN